MTLGRSPAALGLAFLICRMGPAVALPPRAVAQLQLTNVEYWAQCPILSEAPEWWLIQHIPARLPASASRGDC